MPLRILIVDDHAIVRRMLRVLVETHSGWEVCAEAENGQEAIAELEECNPDVVIMDMAMPVKDGITASREISATAPNVPIIMHTLHYSPELELEAKKAGVRKVVAKAESGDALLNAISELLQEDSGAGLSRTGHRSEHPQEISAMNKQEQKETPAGSDRNSRRRGN